QSPRPPIAILTGDATDSDSQPGGVSSPASRFALVAATAQVDVPQPSSRPPKRSVLEPMTPRWLEDDAPEPPKAATSPQTLNPDFLSSPPGPAPETMPEELAPGAAEPVPDAGELLPGGRRRLFE